MKIGKTHAWELSPRKAAMLQEKLRSAVRLQPLGMRTIRTVAGCDVAVSRRLGKLVAAVVVVRLPELETMEERVATASITFPYVPGLLSFREVPGLLRALEKVKTPFHVLLCDGQGIAHPRRLGLASHLGLLIGIPTIGCAKSRLVGEHGDVGEERGSYTPLKMGARTVGSVLRTRPSVKPMYISPGHLIDNRSARRIALACCRRYRIPEPTRRAHILAEMEKRRLESGLSPERRREGSDRG